ncbi:hypothetical protein LUX33_46200 [Actinomadura madurae]|uniref:hypothetical protein n=1 Tax=Actinomadura madurae TaxID=1993 RepID=UPI0020D22F1C|nr:hypothetical protein [Actinomadura madurae]MCP9955035.1 hypothetical protein [Actinomadura madurae]
MDAPTESRSGCRLIMVAFTSGEWARPSAVMRRCFQVSKTWMSRPVLAASRRMRVKAPLASIAAWVPMTSVMSVRKPMTVKRMSALRPVLPRGTLSPSRAVSAGIL